MNDITALAQRMKAAADKATALNLDTAQEIRDEDGCIECPACGGEGHVDAERDYCNIDKVALGVQFYGIGEHHDIAEEYFRQVVPANVLALVEALENAQAINAAAEKLVRCKGRYHSEQNYRALAALFGVNTPDLPPLDGESQPVTVKLPSGTGWASDPYNHGRNDGISECAKELRAAGINVEAE